MKKQRLNERFKQLAGIKPLYEMPKRFHGTAQDRRDEFDPFAHVGSEEEFYTQIQRDMKDIYDLDVPMEEIEKWVAGYHFPYSSWDHEKDEPGPKVLAWETEERIDFIEYLRDKGLAPRPGPESDPPQNYQDAVKSGKYKDMGGNPLKEEMSLDAFLKNQLAGIEGETEGIETVEKEEWLDMFGGTKNESGFDDIYNLIKNGKNSHSIDFGDFKANYNLEIGDDKIIIKYKINGRLKEFRRTGRQYKAQGQGGSAGNRRPGIMRGPDIEDRDDEEYTSKGDPNIDKGDFYDYSPYGFTIRFLGYEDGDDVIVRGNGFFSEKVKNGKVTFKSYPMKDAQGNRLEDAQGNRPGTPNSAYKLSDNYDESNIVDVLGNDHPFVVMTKSNHWKNNHSIDIDDNSISITLDTPNNLPRGLAPLSESKEKQKIREFIRKSIKKLI